MSYLIRGLPRTTLPPLTAFSQDDWGLWCTGKLQNLQLCLQQTWDMEPSSKRLTGWSLDAEESSAESCGWDSTQWCYGFCFSILEGKQFYSAAVNKEKRMDSLEVEPGKQGSSSDLLLWIYQASSPLDFISPWPSRVCIFLLFVGILMFCISQGSTTKTTLNGICRVMPSTKQFPLMHFYVSRLRKLF